tara:strand:+ start:770 stop:946 length:177 start_codon:yes stop_codon:yes gene_type:complete
MNIQALTVVRKMYNVDYVPASTNRYNQRQWVRALRILGDNWLLKKQVSRKEELKECLK